MSTLDQITEGLSRAWDTLAEGWRELRDKASHALTRFNPPRENDDLQTADDVVIHHAARWGLLAADVGVMDAEVVVRLEAPGMEAGDFDLSVMRGALVVRGEKRVQREGKRGDYYTMECAYGRFERAVSLPVPVDEAGATATYRNGVLTVHLPRTVKGGTHRIVVGEG